MKFLTKYLLALSLITLLAACGGGSGGSSESNISDTSYHTDMTGSLSLSWKIPTTRTDDSPLTLSEIEGYRIYMGPKMDELSMILDLNDGSITSFTFTDLAPGTYYFSVTTYDTEGNESPFSNIEEEKIL